MKILHYPIWKEYHIPKSSLASNFFLSSMSQFGQTLQHPFVHGFGVHMWLYSLSSGIFRHHRHTLSCALAAMVFSKWTFYYHIMSYGCRDLKRDVDSGWIICLDTGISQSAAGWLNTALVLKCWRQSSQKKEFEKKKKIHPSHCFDAFTDSAFNSTVSLHTSVSLISPFHFFKLRKHSKVDLSIKSKTISPNFFFLRRASDGFLWKGYHQYP